MSYTYIHLYIPICTHAHIHKYIDLLYIRNTTGVRKKEKNITYSHGVKYTKFTATCSREIPHLTARQLERTSKFRNHQRSNTPENAKMPPVGSIWKNKSIYLCTLHTQALMYIYVYIYAQLCTYI